MKQAVPVHILSGFLGSGKTTLLTQALDYYKQSGKKPAVLMNELGDVNLDGMLVEEGVPMSEMLSGCICCTIRGDLGLELRELIQENSPDVIFVECTGAANPMEMLDGVTDASLLTELELKSVITVVDAAQLLEQHRKGAGKTYRLMQEQIRCATHLILNKTDLIAPADLGELEIVIRGWNAVAPITATVRCHIDLTLFDRLEGEPGDLVNRSNNPDHSESDHTTCSHDHEHGAACTDPGHHHEHEGDSPATHKEAVTHHSHDHVMVYTHYFKAPIDSEQFEALVGRLPANVYRAKGILRFSDTTSPFMFQYAYREMDFVKITPKEELPSVAVFIGEHFSKQQLALELEALEKAVVEQKD
ncbi:CobW family GTP-binding protein [Paenibacillus radicis (ex Xue et al. 2023)]|uniref:GTP-binding protein n=1 Tax=Paenibacillus radicis (ex Xue et al. 2023) TaxID=2972489 RepID=A0ABT1YF06_9BACL|nr:GTP-binding protein [Paenibacillus radicis (ex Xue et al. 2023)]MCR8631777.1 GTP-binding protein [Paenibacillus radicis (ex Xue et al. 2023)]